MFLESGSNADSRQSQEVSYDSCYLRFPYRQITMLLLNLAESILAKPTSATVITEIDFDSPIKEINSWQHH
jgi:hypothetical protein